MKIYPIIIAIAAASVPAAAQINSAGAAGYLTRAGAMSADGNYRGCIDQAEQAMRLNPTPAEAEYAAWLRADAAMKAGDPDASALLEAFLNAYPQSPRRSLATLGLGTVAFHQGHIDEALRIFDTVDADALDLDAAEDLTYRRSYCLMMMGDADKALPGFDRLASTGRYGNAARFYQGYIAYTDRDYTRALELLQNVDRNTAPGNMAGYYLAQIYYVKGDWNKALSEARPIVDADVDLQYRAEAARIAGESLWNLGDEDSALAYLRRYLSETDSPLPSALYLLGLADYRNGDYNAAIQRLGHVTGEDGALGQSASLIVGQAYLKQGNYDAAIMSLDKATRMDCDPQVSETAFYNYAVARSAGGRVPFGSSVRIFEDFLRRYPSSRYADEVRQYIVDGYMTDNNYTAALENIERVKNPSARIFAAKQRVLFMLGTHDFATGQYRKALDRFDASLKLASCSPEIALQTRLWRADCLYRLGDYAAASKAYRSYLDKAPRNDVNRTLGLYGEAYSLLALKKYDTARDRFTVVASAAGDDEPLRADAYNRIADTYYYESRFGDAGIFYNRAYEASPSTGDYALFQKAMMLGHTRDYRGKLSGLNDMVARFPKSSLAAEALLEKAQTYVALHDTQQAIDAYRDVIELYPSTSQGRNAMLQLAGTYRNSSDATRAVETYRTIITDYPTSDEAAIAVDDLKALYAEQGRIDELDRFLRSVPSAPQIAESERSALAAQSLWKQAVAAKDQEKALKLLDELTSGYPHAAEAEDALAMKADIEYSTGRTELAARSYSQLEQRASGPMTLTAALLGIVRTGRDLGDNEAVISAADRLMASSTAGNSYAPEVRYARAAAYNATGRTADARTEWAALASAPADMYGARSAVALADSYFNAGQTDKAKQVVNDFIDADPPHAYWLARGFILLSDILRAEGNTFEADEYLRNLRSNYPGSEADIFEMIDQRLKK